MSENQLVSLDNFLNVGKEIDSPRSKDVLFRLGIDAKELYPVHEEEFQRMERDPDIAKEMYDHNEYNRKKKLRIAQNERNDCIRLMEMMQQEGMTFDRIMKNYRAHDGSFIAPSLLREKIKRLEKFIRPSTQNTTRKVSIIGTQGTSVIRAEQHRIEMLKRKQEREIMNLIMLEKRRAEIEKENEEKIKAEEARRKELEKQREIKRRELNEKKKLEELSKKEKEDKENKEIRDKFLADYKKQQEILEQEELKEKQAQKERRMKEEEDYKRQEQLYMETMARRKKQDDAILEKKMKMEQEEKERLRRKEIELEQQFEELRKKRDKMKEKVRLTLLRNEKLEEDRKIAYEEKQKRLNEKLLEEKHKEEERLKLQQLEKREKERRYKEAYDNARAMEEARSQSILEKEKKKEESMNKNRQRIEKFNMIKRTRNYLNQLEKLENVERNTKSQEVYKSLLKEKIDKDDERTREIYQMRTQLTLERQRQQNNAMRQRHEIHTAMERLRVTNSYDNFAKTMERLGMTNENSPNMRRSIPGNKSSN